MKSLFLLFFLSLNSFSFSLIDGNFVDGDSLKSDSGIIGPSYNQQIITMENFAQSNPYFSNIINYGYTLGNRQLTGLLLKRPAPFVTTNLTLITGATHGNEYLNIVDRLAENLLKLKNGHLRTYLNNGGSVLFVPILNPDGYEERERANQNNADLNRDWPHRGNDYRQFKEPESRNLAKWIENYIGNQKRLDFVMDYHCCARGMLLIPWGWKKKLYMSSENKKRSKIYENMLSEFFKRPGRIGTPPDILYPAQGITLDYWHEKYNAISFTYEGRRRAEKKLISNHTKWWDKIFKTLVLQKNLNRVERP